jgi:hypothetical protein
MLHTILEIAKKMGVKATLALFSADCNASVYGYGSTLKGEQRVHVYFVNRGVVCEHSRNSAQSLRNGLAIHWWLSAGSFKEIFAANLFYHPTSIGLADWGNSKSNLIKDLHENAAQS